MIDIIREQLERHPEILDRTVELLATISWNQS